MTFIWKHFYVYPESLRVGTKCAVPPDKIEGSAGQCSPLFKPDEEKQCRRIRTTF